MLLTLAEKLIYQSAYGDLFPDGKAEHSEELWKKEANQIASLCLRRMNDVLGLLEPRRYYMGGLAVMRRNSDVVINRSTSKVAEAIKVGKLTRRLSGRTRVAGIWRVNCWYFILGAMYWLHLGSCLYGRRRCIVAMVIMNAVRIQKKT